ncbi:hypothetical protein A245_41190 [Pseudomonas syringae pv. actinidiae ICMP 19096]|uniref:Uncharacterized protein n=1 Tax=Pseudomonas syringae pv. actinidiae ICMP 19096 TaxID=1194405 RepID=A0A656JLE1_PSESF|nr:hypothetical protein A245_41190 [Pseudomonas syringae pv. actinidiae ICMP 19096]
MRTTAIVDHQHRQLDLGTGRDAQQLPAELTLIRQQRARPGRQLDRWRNGRRGDRFRGVIAAARGQQTDEAE